MITLSTEQFSISIILPRKEDKKINNILCIKYVTICETFTYNCGKMQGCSINWFWTQKSTFNRRCLLFFTESWWKHRYVFIIAATWHILLLFVWSVNLAIKSTRSFLDNFVFLQTIKMTLTASNKEEEAANRPHSYPKVTTTDQSLKYPNGNNNGSIQNR